MIWALVQQVGAQAANSLVILLLAAFLQPEHFGVVAMATVWIGFLSAFAETGFGAAVVQRSDLRSDHLSTTFAINVALGAALAVLGVALAWPAAALYRTPSVAPVVAALSGGFVIRSLGLTQAAYLQRQLRFRDLAIRDLGASFAGAVAGVAGALRGWEEWSLVAMALTNSAASVILVWRATPWRPRRAEISLARARELWPYSSRILGFNVVKALIQNSDRLIIGFFLGPRAVGLYTFAYRIVVFPVRTLSAAVDAYLFPRMSRLQSDHDAVRAEYMFIMRLLLAVVVPAMVVAALVAPDIVGSVFGQNWVAAGRPMQILAVTALAGAFYTPVGDLLKALNRPAWMIAWAVLYALVSCGALWVGAQRGLIGAVTALGLVHVLLLPVVLSMVHRTVGLRSGEIVRQWGPSLAGGGVSALVILAGLQMGERSTAIQAVASVLAGLGAYAVVFVRLDPELPRFVARRLGSRFGFTAS
ncbi:MAG: lipopolysaccharide biosynthesis protein [Gemmatimonadales bacterium]|nr:lipopolysaccharide biosynthesis protein [Gemmatimonadales bacterium]